MNATTNRGTCRRLSGRSTACPVFGWLSIVILVGSRVGWCSEFDGFTEPSRKVKVASVETGTIKTLEVREGASVEKGQILARMDDDVYLVLLEIAAESMRAQGTLKSAQAELDMRRDRKEKLDALRAQGHARQEEVDRARADAEIAEARVLSAQEFMEVKRLEHEKAKIQVARRLVVAPLSGVVTVLHKDEGEFVAPNDPYVLEIVTLDPLLATFSVPSYEAVHLRQDEKVSVYLEDVAKIVEGEVDAVAPLTDAESGTVRVKVRIANPDGQFRGGERCTLQLKNASAAANPRP
jgi:RND family efflux transporter MFP subunit